MGFRRTLRNAGSKNRPCDPFAPSRSSTPPRPSASFDISSTPGAASLRASSIESTPILARARPHRLLTVEELIPMRADASLELSPSIKSRVASTSLDNPRRCQMTCRKKRTRHHLQELPPRYWRAHAPGVWRARRHKKSRRAPWLPNPRDEGVVSQSRKNWSGKYLIHMAAP